MIFVSSKTQYATSY